MSATQTFKILIGIFLLCLFSPAFTHDHAPTTEEFAPVDYQQSKEVNDFIDYMVDRHGFSRPELVSVFDQVQFNPKSLQLIKPAPVTKPKNWAAYRARFIEPQRIRAGVQFWNKYEDALIRAEKQYGVPAQIIVGIIGVETIYGRNVGSFRVVDVLATLGFTYPDTPNRDVRMTYFRGELEHVLLFARESGIDPFSLRGSYAGAIGWPQFMPSSIRQFAVDFEDKGKIDLRNSPADAIGSVANFLLQHGWVPDMPLVFPAKIISDQADAMLATDLSATSTLQQLADVAIPTQNNMPPQLSYGLIDLQNGAAPTEYWFTTQNFFAITKYNRSYFYAMAVIELGKAVCIARGLTNSCDLEQQSGQ